MQTYLIILLCFLVSLSIPLITPFVATISKFKYFSLEQNLARRYALISIFVIVFIANYYYFGLRFQSDAANIVLQFITLTCYLYLVGFVFQIKPRLLGKLLGVFSVVLSLFLILFITLSFETEDKTSQIKLTPNTYCKVNRYGYILEGGLNVSIYKYLGFGIMRRLFYDSYPDEIRHPFQDQEGACNYAMTKLASVGSNN